MADFLRPVPQIVCAAKPPGSLDLTYFFRLTVSGSSPAGARTVAEMASERNLGTCESETSFGRLTERLFGLEEIWEEKERDESEDEREDTETAIVEELYLRVLCSASVCGIGQNGLAGEVERDNVCALTIVPLRRESVSPGC